MQVAVRIASDSEQKVQPGVTVERASEAGDGELVAAAIGGSEAAFGVLVARHSPRVIATARRILGDASEAEDVAQEAFLRLWTGGSGLEVKDGFGIGPWLSRVARNLAIDRLRAGRRLDVRDELPETPVAAEQLAVLTAEDVSARVFEALDALPDRQRLALTLFHFEELSQREVAGELGVSEDALESLLARGRRKLRALLAEDWVAWREDDGREP